MYILWEENTRKVRTMYNKFRLVKGTTSTPWRTKRHGYKATCIWPLEGIKCHGLTRDLFMKGVTKRHAYKATCFQSDMPTKRHAFKATWLQSDMLSKRHAYKATCIWPLEGIKCHRLTRDLFMKGVTKRHAYKATCLQSDMHVAPRGHQVPWADKGFVYERGYTATCLQSDMLTKRHAYGPSRASSAMG